MRPRRLLPWFTLVLFLLAGFSLPAENVADMPIPTSYVNDFAHVLSPAGAQRIEDLARAVHNQANADMAVVTVNNTGGEALEQFTADLEEKWKLGKKGQDRSTILLLVLNPHRLRVETGYGLEGILNDAKVGGILDQARPYATAGNYDQALFTAEQGLATVVAADAHVTLQPVIHQYHRQAQPVSRHFGLSQIVIGIVFVLVLFFLIKTGNLGWALLLLSSLSGGGGGGGGGGDDEGGGFGGVGGGASGGGGASRDF
jgi:uncharacterized protein